MSMSDTLSLASAGVRCPVTVERLLIDAGSDVVSRGTRLLRWTRGTAAGEVKMPFGGTLVSWETAAGTTITNAAQTLAVLSACKHPVEWGGMCASCGDDVKTYAVRLTHDALGPTVSREEAFRIEHETAQRLANARKLSLIVDLDQTVVHATVDPTVGDWIAHGDPNPNYSALADVKRFVLADASSPDGCWYYIKPRPGLADFLRNLAAKYEMHVYTMGTRAYATQVCNAIDPDHSLFADRILSRDESGSMTHKNIERLFPVDQSMVVIIDDRADVWDSHQNNLVKVIPYDFFVGIGDINAGLLPKQQDALHIPDPPQKTTTPPGSPRPTHAAIPPPDDRPNLPVADPTPTDPPSPGDSQSTDQSTDQSDSDPKDTPPPLFIDIPPDSLPTPSLSLPTPTLEQVATLEAVRAKLQARGSPRPPINRVPSTGTPNGSDTPEPTEEQAQAREEAEEAAAVRGSIIETVREERPLARKLEAMVCGKEPDDAPTDTPQVPARAVLRDDDRELDRIYALLDEIHTRFYDAYDREWVQANGNARQGASRNFNVQRIIPAIKRRVLQGVHVLFSSVIPMNVDPTCSEYWRQSELFGATCHMKLGPMVTHVVAAKRGTEKVNQARARGNVAIVRPEWLHRVVTTWTRAPEEDFLLDPSERDEFMRRKTVGVLSSSADAGPSNDGDEESSTGTELDESAREQAEDILHGFDYQAELDALMDSDTETDDGSASGRSTPVVVAGSSQPLKRQRSVTPSLVTACVLDPNDPNTRSPLAKRKRLSEMRGSSRLGNEIGADDATVNGAERNKDADADDGDQESSESSSDSDIEDFLAADLFGENES